MKRPLAGLLASAAAVPGAWLLANADRVREPGPVSADPDTENQISPVIAPAQRLAAIAPAFGQPESAPASLPAQSGAAVPEPALSAPVAMQPRAEPEPALPPSPAAGAEMAAAPAQAGPIMPGFVSEPQIQPLPQPAFAASSPEPAAAIAEIPPAPVGLIEPALVAAPAPSPQGMQFTARPLVQSLPQQTLAYVPAPTPAAPSAQLSAAAPLPDPPRLAEAKTEAPAAPVPVPSARAKLPSGEVVLAAYTPPPLAVMVSASPAKVRGGMLETTAARTVPVGMPAPITYPEPTFGYPEARLVPAALSLAETPEQPSAIGSASTLTQAIAYSYETNPRLLAERASVRASDLGYPAARAAFGPRLDASASLSYTRDRDELLPGSFLRQQGWSDTASLILSQPLLTFGRSQARVGEAAANVDYHRESLKLVQNEVMLDVIASYVGTLREAGAVTIARENVALLQRQLAESNARFAVREITLADVQQVETRLALGKTGLLDAQARLGEVQSRFYRAVGLPPGELAPPEPLALPATSLSDAYALADSDSPLVRAAQARERISRAALSASRAQSAPRVDFRGSADYGAMSDYSRDLRGTRVRGTVTLSVPLFDSGARSAESAQAREANLADLQLVAAAQRDSRTAVATGWNKLLAARMSIGHYRQAVESAQRGYENAQRQERAGMRTTLDVLDLARDLLNVRNAYNAALADEYLARASLLASLGRLDPAAMSAGITLYDPADHFRKVRGKGDFPLLTGTLAALDGVTLPDLKADRPSPDAANLLGTAETVTGE